MTGNSDYFQVGIFWLMPIPALYLAKYYVIDLGAIYKTFIRFVYVSTIVNVLQILLFVFAGRLPALAYHESLFVRFGSIWDDPNSYGVFLSFVIPFIYYSELRGFKRHLLLWINIGALFATQSYTAIGSLIWSFGLITIIALWRRKQLSWLRVKRHFFLIRYALFTVFCIAAFVFLSLSMNEAGPIDSIMGYMESKKGSVDIHADDANNLFKSDILSLLGLRPLDLLGESGYVNQIVNFGIFATAGYIFLIGYVCRITLRLIEKKESVQGIAVYYGALFYFGSYMLAMTNLPMDRVFPTNIIFIILATLVFQGSTRSSKPNIL